MRLEHLPSSVTRTGGDARFVSRLTRETLALVMAGGRGSRLHGLTDGRAKPSVPFGGKYRIIDFALSNCINSGVRRVGVLTQYKAHSLIRHVQTGWSFLRGEMGEFVELLPAQQRVDEVNWYVGTADAVYQNLDIVRAHAPRQVLILAGDHIYKMDYGRMLAEHAASDAQITVGCVEVPLDEASSFGVMEVDALGRIVRFDEKPLHARAMPDKPDRALASMGIYIIETEFLIECLSRDAANPDSSHDFGKDIIPSAITNSRVFASPLRDVHDPERDAYWRDVGTIDAFWQANVELTNVIPELDLYDLQWPIWTAALQSPPAKFICTAGQHRGEAIDSIVSGGCIVGGKVRRSVLSSNVRIEDGSRVEDCVILPGTVIGPRCHIRRAVIDEGCVLPEGTEIGYSETSDRLRFFRTNGGITLVTRPMVGLHPSVL